MSVGNLCQRHVVAILAGAGPTAAAKLMRQDHVGYLVVVEPLPEEDGLKLVGVLTDRDIVIAVVAREADPRTLTVGDVMTRDPLLAKESSSVEATLHYMREVGVRRVPVLSTTDRLIGVLALDDALGAVAEQLSDIAGCVRNEQRVERFVRA
jgi:CBS domain-containing protein